jgi:hypothetical protein
VFPQADLPGDIPGPDRSRIQLPALRLAITSADACWIYPPAGGVEISATRPTSVPRRPKAGSVAIGKTQPSARASAAKLRRRGERSSAGRAPGCGPGGRRFESGRSPLTKPPLRRGFCIASAARADEAFVPMSSYFLLSRLGAAMTEPTLCGHPTPKGPCTRSVLPGVGGCGFHPAPSDPPDQRHPEPVDTCGCPATSCSRPARWRACALLPLHEVATGPARDQGERPGRRGAHRRRGRGDQPAPGAEARTTPRSPARPRSRGGGRSR